MTLKVSHDFYDEWSYVVYTSRCIVLLSLFGNAKRGRSHGEEDDINWGGAYKCLICWLDPCIFLGRVNTNILIYYVIYTFLLTYDVCNVSACVVGFDDGKRMIVVVQKYEVTWRRPSPSLKWYRFIGLLMLFIPLDVWFYYLFLIMPKGGEVMVRKTT